MPWITLKPVTFAVMEPRATAANAVVDIWPIDPTETITREYSRMPVLLNGEMMGYRAE